MSAGAVLATLAMATGGGPAAGGPTVEIHHRAFTPGTTSVLVGETVTWANRDGVDHDIIAAGDAFASPVLAPGARFTHTFTAQGAYEYRCTFHRFMRGRVEVFGLGLRASGRAVGPGGSATLSGRAPAGVGHVEIEQQDEGSAWRRVAEAVPGEAGAYEARIPVSRPVVLRARAGELTSRPLALGPSPTLRLRARRHGAHIALSVAAEPAQPGARVVLQRYVRERFSYRAYRTSRLDAGSRAEFMVRSRARERFRLVLPRGVNGFGRATSPVARVLPARR